MKLQYNYDFKYKENRGFIDVQGVKGCLPPPTSNFQIIHLKISKNTSNYSPKTFKNSHFTPLNIKSLDVLA